MRKKPAHPSKVVLLVIFAFTVGITALWSNNNDRTLKLVQYAGKYRLNQIPEFIGINIDEIRVFDNTLYVVFQNKDYTVNSLVAYDIISDKKIWSTNFDTKVNFIRSSDDNDENNLYVTSDNSYPEDSDKPPSTKLSAIDRKSGHVVWTQEDAPIFSHDLFFSDEVILMQRGEGGLTAISKHTGEVLWEKYFTGVYLMIKLSDNRVYVTNNGETTAIDSASGDELWHTPKKGDWTTDFIQAGDALISSFTEVGYEYNKKYIIAENVKNGKQLWRKDYPSVEKNSSMDILNTENMPYFALKWTYRDKKADGTTKEFYVDGLSGQERAKTNLDKKPSGFESNSIRYSVEGNSVTAYDLNLQKTIWATEVRTDTRGNPDYIKGIHKNQLYAAASINKGRDWMDKGSVYNHDLIALDSTSGEKLWELKGDFEYFPTELIFHESKVFIHQPVYDGLYFVSQSN